MGDSDVGHVGPPCCCGNIQSGCDPGARLETFSSRPILPVIIVFLILSHIAVFARIWTRYRILHHLGWDDAAIVASLILFTVYNSTLLAVYISTADAPSLELVTNPSLVINLILSTELFYITTMMALKISLALFFLRLLTIPSRMHTALRSILTTAVSLSTLIGTIYFCFAIFQCGIPGSGERSFLAKMMQGKCANASVGLGLGYAHGVVTMLTDWTCGLLPVCMLWKSTMPRRAKTLIGLLLGVAAVGSVASVVRLVFIDSIVLPKGDFFVRTAKLAVWSTIEPGIGITVASVATLRPLFRLASRRTIAVIISTKRSTSGVGKRESKSIADSTRGGSPVTNPCRGLSAIGLSDVVLDDL